MEVIHLESKRRPPVLHGLPLRDFCNDGGNRNGNGPLTNFEHWIVVITTEHGNKGTSCTHVFLDCTKTNGLVAKGVSHIKMTGINIQRDALVMVGHGHHRKHSSNEAKVDDELDKMDLTASERPHCSGSTGHP